MMSRSKPTSEDRYVTIAEVARAAEVDAQIVRFYARTGLIRPARHGANGYRLFTSSAAKQVRFVRAAQSLGFALSEIREIMRRSRQRQTPCPLVREMIVQRLVENREQLEHIASLQKRMELASTEWRHMPDSAPDGDTICALIEAVAEHPSAQYMARTTAPVRRRAPK